MHKSILELKNMNSWSCKTDPDSSVVIPSQERRCLSFRFHLEGWEEYRVVSTPNLIKVHYNYVSVDSDYSRCFFH